MARLLTPGGEEYAWPDGWKWMASDSVAKPSAGDEAWLEELLPSRCAPPATGELAFIQYTSGSTGHPKGVMITVANIVANVHAMRQFHPMTAGGKPGDNFVNVSWLPQYHDMGLIGGCLCSALNGWRSDLLSPHTFLSTPLSWLLAISRLAQVVVL